MRVPRLCVPIARLTGRARLNLVCSTLLLLVVAASEARADGRAWGHRDRAAGAGVSTIVSKATAADPAGDTFGTGAPIDATSLAANAVGAELVLEMSFAGEISAPSSGAGNALAGFIDLDVDSRATTGEESFVDFLTDFESGTGSEFYVDLLTYRSDDARVDLMAADGSVAGRVEMTVAASSIDVRIPLAMLGDDGSVRAAAVVGTHAEATDTVPNGGYVQTAPEGDAVLVNGSRFAVEVDWKDFGGTVGSGTLGVRSDDSAIFWFFSDDNWELMVKVLNGCGFNQNYWVFTAATTTVEYTVTVTDTQTGDVRRYINPLGTAASAVNDTEAFGNCP